MKPPGLVISILLVGTTWKRKTLNALDQFHKILLSLKHLLHAVLFVGIPSVAVFQVIDVAISDEDEIWGGSSGLLHWL